MFENHQEIEIRNNVLEASWRKGIVVDNRILIDGDSKQPPLELSSYSSRLRPLPPPVAFGIWDLPFGLHVDVNSRKAWREGVIFDYNYECKVRTVFLPDCGSEIKAEIENLRISQEWDRLTGTWKRRGSWPLLGLIEECDKDLPTGADIPAIAKQVWFAMFEKFLQCNYMSKPLCKELVCQFLNSDVVVDSVQKKASKGKESKPKSRKRKRKPESWIYVDPMELGGAEYCPNAITDYACVFANSQKPSEPLVLRMRKHLLYLGWKIERMKYKDSENIFRFRYTSPDGKKYLSLNQLSKDLGPRNSLEWNVGDYKLPKRSGKRVNFPTILSLLIENNVVAVGMKVHYSGGKNYDQSYGRITRDGIQCICCDNVFSLSEFEAHAGSTRHRPSEHIFLEDGRSLLDCKKKLGREGRQRITIKSSKRRKDQPFEDIQDGNDHICSICLDGGDLILCDKCPSAFHKDCIGLQVIPDGDWFCPLCCCKICSHYENENLQQDDGCIHSCHQCMRKFHLGCARDKGSIKLERKDNWYCSNKCEEISLALQKLIGQPILVGEGESEGEDNLSWILLKSSKNDTSDEMLLSDNNRVRLTRALEAMRECFEPVEDAYSGRDLMEDVIFGKESKLSRLNFQGFYTVILERDNEVITVANVRILGDKLAEVPLIATRFQYRRLGMCRILMDQLEKLLISLGVEHLVLPAASVTLDTWIGSFGFNVMTDNDRNEYLGYSFLDFQGTIMCQKSLRNSSSGSCV
ncbi:hypothetical protein JCGZ_16029 [Jatropha curcas]|uniref:PHD-type domain-containing protein n=1 Tax=Jatropha curcas TaxID=180498 RepID=A0A067KZL3_JATCU|nr:increased DNA methylation 1 [Jatropha curcas]KDP41622.1 hypothetical protein JCGZ_16029 [Jatropha curcas]